MSWGREKYKKAYNRSQSDRQHVKDLAEEELSVHHCDYYERDEYYHGPTLHEISVGRLLTILVKLNIKSALDLLERWYW